MKTHRHRTIKGFFGRIESSLFRIGRVFLYAIVFIAYFTKATPTIAQWQLMHNFGNSTHYISSISFLNNIDTGSYTCFIGLWGYAAQTYAEIWRTTDGGKNWQLVFKSQNGFESKISAMIFKDNSTGWFSLSTGAGPFASLGGCYKTIDAGNTWSKLTLDGNIEGDDCMDVYYQKSTGQLFLSRWENTALLSSDEGMSWTSIDPINPGLDFNGYSFVNSFVGISTTVRVGGIPGGPYYRTLDGGITWSPLSLDSEAYQPTCLKNVFYILSEFGDKRDHGLVIKSNDFGDSWQQIYEFPFGVTGSILSDSSILYIQSLDSIYLQQDKYHGHGIYYSEDKGFSWVSICGPNTIYDTRFYVNKGRVWAGDKWGNLWLNSNGIGSNSSPQLSPTLKLFNALGCDPKIDSLITFTFFDSCNGIQAKLVSASLQGSNNFSFSSPSAIPRTIHPDDSLIISYDPKSATPDTAQLHLRFHLGWKDFDTTIQLFGAGRIPKETVQFIPSLSANSAAAGNTVDLFIKPDKIISSKGLQSISFDLHYNGDVLDEGSRKIGTSIPGAVISLSAEMPSPLPLSRREREIHVTITGNDLSLDPAQPIADIKFQAMVTLETSTAITMTNLQLNNGDQNFANCILSADSSNANFTLIPECGDSIIREYLRTGKVLEIISMRPNPASDEIEIQLRSLVNQDVTIEIFNAFGAKKLSAKKNMTNGLNTIHLETKGLSSGMYLVKVGDASQSLVIRR